MRRVRLPTTGKFAVSQHLRRRRANHPVLVFFAESHAAVQVGRFGGPKPDFCPNSGRPSFLYNSNYHDLSSGNRIHRPGRRPNVKMPSRRADCIQRLAGAQGVDNEGVASHGQGQERDALCRQDAERGLTISVVQSGSTAGYPASPSSRSRGMDPIGQRLLSLVRSSTWPGQLGCRRPRSAE